jgi:hypothetical protein
VNITEYFSKLETSLRRHPSIVRVDEPQAYFISDEANGLLKCRVHFWDDSFLDIYEVVSVELGYPVRISYLYAYFRVSGPVFRYDNAPHHPHIATFPHHKHLFPEQIVPTDQPTLSQILAEIDDLVSKR